MKSRPIALTPLLAPLALLYGFAMRVRAWFFHTGVFPSESCGSVVVSIGNIQAGGTGKTPITAMLAERWKAKLRLGIVSRGYRRQSTGVLRVNPDAPDAPLKFGDEPAWMAKSAGVPVQVGESRLEAARELVSSEGLRLVLLDDGFQHMKLRRTFDIVLLDVSAPKWHWHVLPWGRMREPFSALRRADAIILTKCESVDSEYVESFERKIRTRLAGFSHVAQTIPILRFRQDIAWPDPVPGEDLVLAAGLANPDSFFRLVKEHSSGPKVVSAIPYPDHHEFTADDVLRLKREASAARAKRVLVTEKDTGKLEKIWKQLGPDIPLVNSRLEVRPQREFDERELERLDAIVLDLVGRAFGGAGR